MSQVNFFITNNELDDILVQLISSEEYLLFKGSCFDVKTPEPILDLKKVKDTKDYVVWVKSDLAPPQCQKMGSGPNAHKFLFDMYFDPILEVSRCSFSNKLISPGRLYYKSGWIKDPALRQFHKKAAARLNRLFNKGLRTLSSSLKNNPKRSNS